MFNDSNGHSELRAFLSTTRGNFRLSRPEVHLDFFRLHELKTNLEACQNYILEHVEDESMIENNLDFDVFQEMK